MNFTEQQLKDWKVYERVRQRGRYNMFDPRARRATGLGEEKYSFCIKYYSDLKRKVEGEKSSQAGE